MSVALAGCGSTQPYQTIAPAPATAFECAIRQVGDMGYTLVELDGLKRTFRAELRHGAGSSRAELLVVEMVDGTSLKVSAWLVHHYQIFAAGTPQERTQYESPSDITVDDADNLIETCTKDGEQDAPTDPGAPSRRGRR